MARYRDLTQFVAALEADGLVRRIDRPVSVVHEMTEIHRRVIQANGPALLFEKPVGADGRPFAMPVLVNLFGTEERIARGLGVTVEGVPALGEMLAFLRQPTAPDSLRAMVDALPSARAALAMGCKRTLSAPIPPCNSIAALFPSGGA